jgi:23S rRNA pseudouridine1911/1915/1917 synthase
MKSSDSVEIIYSDNHLLVVSKPAGMLTQPDEQSDAEDAETFCKSWIKHKFHKKGAVFLHAIHRLDKPVSGLLLFARTSKALSRLNEQSRNLEIQKVYLAEVEGEIKTAEGRLDHYLIHGDHRAIVSKEGAPEAKHARLTYQIIEKTPRTTFVRIELETGRYHQIRAQFSAIGHPIIGDVRYGAKQAPDEAIHLHCSQLLLKHPVTQELLSFETPAPFAPS